MVSVRRRERCRAHGREGGFTIVELLLAMLLFSIIVYASMSLVSTTSNTMAKMFSEFDSFKRVNLLQREMAEGTEHYAGYLGAHLVEFRPGEHELGGACVFRIWFPDFHEGFERKVEYIWWPEGPDGPDDPRHEAIMQRIDDGELRRLLSNVEGFSVTKVHDSHHTLRVEIAHRVRGFTDAIVRATEGQARNMNVRKFPLESVLLDCPYP